MNALKQKLNISISQN